MLILLGLFLGCKKNNNDKVKGCRIVTITSPGVNGFQYQLTYDNDHQVERVISGASVNLYVYNTNIITIDQYDSGTFRRRMTVTINNAGLATNVRTNNDVTGASWSNSVNEYNGDQIVRTTNTSSGGAGAGFTTTYGWSNGDMVWSATAGDTTHFDYYTDQPRMAGDFLSLVQMLQGYEIYRNKHLLRSYAGAIFQYDHANDGKITSLQYFLGNTLSILNYEYDCN